MYRACRWLRRLLLFICALEWRWCTAALWITSCERLPVQWTILRTRASSHDPLLCSNLPRTPRAGRRAAMHEHSVYVVMPYYLLVRQEHFLLKLGCRAWGVGITVCICVNHDRQWDCERVCMSRQQAEKTQVTPCKSYCYVYSCDFSVWFCGMFIGAFALASCYKWCLIIDP